MLRISENLAVRSERTGGERRGQVLHLMELDPLGRVGILVQARHLLPLAGRRGGGLFFGQRPDGEPARVRVVDRETGPLGW